MAVSLLQSKTGHDTTATTTIALDAPTQDNTTVVIALCTEMPVTGSIMAGFNLDHQVGTGQNIQYWRRPSVAAGESSWTFANSFSGAMDVTWGAFELDACEALDATASNDWTTGSRSTLSTGTTGTTTVDVTYAIAVHGWFSTTVGALTGSFAFSNYTNGFAEIAQIKSAEAATPKTTAIAVSALQLAAIGTVGCTADITNSTPDASEAYGAAVAVYRGAAVEAVPAPTLIVAS